MKKLLIANWKMNGHINMCREFVNEIKKSEVSESLKMVICPPAIYIPCLRNEIDKHMLRIKLGGQNGSTDEKTNKTGEISFQMLKENGCEYVIVGHSERRSSFSESNVDVRQKAENAILHGLLPIICVGNADPELDEEFLRNQVMESIPLQHSEYVVAYEPVYAIGTGALPSNKSIADAVQIILNVVPDSIPILYGGSVSQEACGDLLTIQNLSGFLVGGASLKATSLLGIAKQIFLV